MSDEIIINIIPPASDNIQISTGGSGVLSVNGRYGDIVLTKNDVGLDQVDNTSDLNKPLSLASLSAFNNINSSVVPNSANWNQAYSNLVSNSGFYLSGVDLTFLSVSGNWNSVYNNVNSTSAEYVTKKYATEYLPISGGNVNGDLYVTYLSATSAVINVLDLKVYELSGFNVEGDVLIKGDVSITKSISTTDYGSTSNWFSVYNNVNSLSGNWSSVYNNINSLSGNWSSVYNNVNSTSANYATKNYVSGYLPVSGGNITSLSSNQLTANRISFSDLTFTGNSFYATASARCSFVEVRVGNVLKYLPLYDITKAIIYYVDFEGPAEVKASYASGNVTLSGISWNLTEALIGTETNEIISGARSARLRGYATTTMTMLADKADGISNISFLYRSYINPTLVADTTQVTWNVEYSTDTGTTWLTAGTFTALPLIQTFNANVNVTGPARIRFRTNATGSTNRRTNIDNITINPYT